VRTPPDERLIEADESDLHAYQPRLMRRVLGYVRPYRGRVWLAGVIVIADTLAGLAGPWLTKEAIDNGIRHRDLLHLDLVASLYLSILVIGFGLSFLHQRVMQRVAQRVTMDLRLALFDHLQRLPISHFDGRPVGRLLTRVTGDVESIQELVTGGVAAVFGDLFMLIGIVVAMCRLNVELLGVAFSVLPLIIVVTLLLRSRARRTFRKIRTRYAELIARLTESLSGMATIQMMGAERSQALAFRRVNGAHREANLRAVFDQALIFPALELVGALTVSLIVWYGGRQVMWTGITLGTLVAFIQYTQRFFRPVGELSEKYSLLQQAMAAAERIFGLLDTPPDDAMAPIGAKTVPAAPHQAESGNGVTALAASGTIAVPRDSPRWRGPLEGRVELDHVWFAYQGENWVLEDVSLSIVPGERVALVGVSGSGKTTLMHLLLRFYEPQRGEIRIDGRPLREWDLSALRTQMGVVLQDVFLFSDTVAGNLTPDASATRSRIERAAREVCANEFIERLPNGYDTLLVERGATLSAGQRQLLAFARALVREPRLLMLDEATSSVDPQTENLLQAGVQRMLAGRTCLVIAHRLTTVQDVDRIAVLHHGRVRELGTHRELLARGGIYSRLHELHFRSGRVPARGGTSESADRPLPVAG
jgi:ATP-binding cassette subfamily B protein